MAPRPSARMAQRLQSLHEHAAFGPVLPNGGRVLMNLSPGWLLRDPLEASTWTRMFERRPVRDAGHGCQGGDVEHIPDAVFWVFGGAFGIGHGTDLPRHVSALKTYGTVQKQLGERNNWILYIFDQFTSKSCLTTLSCGSNVAKLSWKRNQCWSKLPVKSRLLYAIQSSHVIKCFEWSNVNSVHTEKREILRRGRLRYLCFVRCIKKYECVDNRLQRSWHSNLHENGPLKFMHATVHRSKSQKKNPNCIITHPAVCSTPALLRSSCVCIWRSYEL